MRESKRETFNNQELEKAIARLSLMKFFPAEPSTRAALKDALIALCPHREALEWLVLTCQTRVAEWPGVAELRGLLCTRYMPADGIEAGCSLPGYSSADFEAKHFEEHQALKAGGYSQAFAEVWDDLIGELPELKRLQ